MLNGFAFGLSLNESFGGFKTEIHSDIYVAPISNIGWSAGQSLTRSDRPIEQTLDAFREFVAPAIEDLLDAAHTSSGLSDLQNKLGTPGINITKVVGNQMLLKRLFIIGLDWSIFLESQVKACCSIRCRSLA